MKVVVCDGIEQGCIDVLRSEGFEVVDAAGSGPDQLPILISDADALVVRSATRVTADLIGTAHRLRVIGRAGAGVDTIDVQAATRRGILVMNTPGGNTISTAEHTVSMLLAMARHIPRAHMSVTSGKWEKKKFTGTEVFEKTVGIIGLGRVGREVAVRCRGLGMNVIGYDPLPGPEAAGRMQVELVGLEELYRRSDFITIHTPLNRETRGLLNDETLSRCKRGVRIVNCARGGIVDEAALLRALETGQVAGAALDVFAVEPPANNPLLAHEHVVATPHLGASTDEAQEKVAVQIAHQVVDALKGRGFAGVVNSAAVQLGMSEGVQPFLLLAQRMGNFVAQMTTGKLQGLTVGVSGKIATGSLELLKAGILNGILSRLLSQPVNVVNAPVLAAEAGLRIGESKEAAGAQSSDLVSVRYSSDGGTREVSGTVFDASEMRFVQMDGFRIEVHPEGHLLIYRNIDRPGVLAAVSAILANYNVNIAGVSLGRSVPGGAALTVMNVDGDVSGPALAELRALDTVTDLKLVWLG